MEKMKVRKYSELKKIEKWYIEYGIDRIMQTTCIYVYIYQCTCKKLDNVITYFEKLLSNQK